MAVKITIEVDGVPASHTLSDASSIRVANVYGSNPAQLLSQFLSGISGKLLEVESQRIQTNKIEEAQAEINALPPLS